MEKKIIAGDWGVMERKTHFFGTNLFQFKKPMQQVYAPREAFIGGCRCIFAQRNLCAMVFSVGERLSSAAIHALTVFYVPLHPKPLLPPVGCALDIKPVRSSGKPSHPMSAIWLAFP